MSENTKFRADALPGKMSLTADTAVATESSPLPDVEAQMRRALGLYGGGLRSRPDGERADQSARMTDRPGQQGSHQGLHRRRFVQDGEVPVTVVRRDPAMDNPASSPQSSRLQRAEAALAAETAARDRAERALVDAQSQIAALQTKIGHAELARVEAVESARRERDAVASLREFSDGFEAQLQALRDQVDAAEHAKRSAQAGLADERAARKTIERTLRNANDRVDHAEGTLALLERERDTENQDPTPRRGAPAYRSAAAPSARPADSQPARRGRPPGSKSAAKPPVQSTQDAEPVKWWLAPSPKAKGR